MLRIQIAETAPGKEVLRCFRVGSAPQSTIYQALKQSLEAERGAAPLMERELWHGTSWASIPKILQSGFNRSFAGQHGKLLGIATYFSSDLSYSLRFCDRGGGKQGTKAVLLSRVLVGEHCRGAPTDVEPPRVKAGSGLRFHSTVDSVERPKIFAVFKDFQAIPLFLVELRC